MIGTFCVTKKKINFIFITIYFLYYRLCTEVTNKQTAKTNLNLADYVRVNHISLLKKDMTTNPQLQSNKFIT